MAAARVLLFVLKLVIFLCLFLGKMTAKYKVVIVPRNDCFDVYSSNWYGWLQKELTEKGFTCDLRRMPDHDCARASVWIPFMRTDLECNEHTIVVGHGSGAQAAMRFAEMYKTKGLVLVSACITDLGIEVEHDSGYYNGPWRWINIKDNTDFVVQFGATDNPFIPWSEQERVADCLNCEMHVFQRRGHFMNSTFPELLALLLTKLNLLTQGGQKK